MLPQPPSIKIPLANKIPLPTSNRAGGTISPAAGVPYPSSTPGIIIPKPKAPGMIPVPSGIPAPSMIPVPSGVQRTTTGSIFTPSSAPSLIPSPAPKPSVGPIPRPSVGPIPSVAPIQLNVLPQPLKLTKSGGITKQFTTKSSTLYQMPPPGTSHMGIVIREQPREEVMEKMLRSFWTEGTDAQVKELIGLTYSGNAERFVLSEDRIELLMEIVGMLKTDDYKNVVAFLRSTSGPDEVLWQQSAMDIGRTKIARELTLLQFEETGVKGVGKCKYCGGTEMSFQTKQLRSGDEPATIFWRCLLCHKQGREH